MADWKIEVFYDGDCPLCVKEIGMLRWMDRKSRIRFTDIAKPDFDPAEIGKSFEDVMRSIHGRLPNGSVIEGANVFRHLYSAVGFGPVVFITKLPLMRQICDGLYRVFAKYRLRMTGRCLDEACELRRPSDPQKAA